MKMNRKIMITAFLMLSTIFSYGQFGKDFKTSFGLKGGVNLSTINNGEANIPFSANQSVGFNAGAFMNFHFGSYESGSAIGTGLFGIQPELLFSQQGFSEGGNAIRFNYISIPVLAKLYVKRGFNLEVGPYFNYMLNATPNSSLLGVSEIQTENLKESKDVGLIFGAGYETTSGFLIDVRYNYGLSEVASNLAWKNQVIAISLGWIFRHKEKEVINK